MSGIPPVTIKSAAIIHIFCVQAGRTGGVLMNSRFQALWLCACSGALLLLLMGCNDTLRQFITPIPPPTGNPSGLSHAIVLSTNPATLGDGSNMHIDVSGDTNVGIVTLGINPIFLGKLSNRIFAINAG